MYVAGLVLTALLVLTVLLTIVMVAVEERRYRRGLR